MIHRLRKKTFKCVTIDMKILRKKNAGDMVNSLTLWVITRALGYYLLTEDPRREEVSLPHGVSPTPRFRFSLLLIFQFVPLKVFNHVLSVPSVSTQNAETVMNM